MPGFTLGEYVKHNPGSVPPPRQAPASGVPVQSQRQSLGQTLLAQRAPRPVQSADAAGRSAIPGGGKDAPRAAASRRVERAETQVPVLHRSAPGLIVPATPLDHVTTSTYKEVDKASRRRMNVQRNASQVSINPQRQSTAVEKPMQSGKGINPGTYTKNRASFKLEASEGPESPRKRVVDRMKGRDRLQASTEAFVPGTSMNRFSVSSENTMVSGSLKNFVDRKAHDKADRKTQKKYGLKTLSVPLEKQATDEVIFLQSSERREIEYATNNKHSDNTKWLRKKVEHDSPTMRRQKMRGTTQKPQSPTKSSSYRF